MSSKATPKLLSSKATPQPLSSKASRGCTVDVQPWMHLIPLLLWSTRAALFLCLPAGRRPRGLLQSPSASTRIARRAEPADEIAV